MVIGVAGLAVLAAVASAAGIGEYSIVRPEVVSKTDAFVLEDVRGLLSRGLDGRKPPVCAPDAAPAAKRIFFGIPSPGFDVASLKNQEHVVEVRDGDVYLFGGGTNGTRYAAYCFLQDMLGYRFFDARGGMRVPDLASVKLADGVRRRKFPFEDRFMSCWTRYTGAESAMFLFRHGMNGATQGSYEKLMERECKGSALECDDGAVSDFCAPWPASHGLPVFLPRNFSVTTLAFVKEIVGDNLEKRHPEYFSLNGGSRVFGHQRCLSNPEVRELLKKVLFAMMSRLKAPSYIDLSAGDTPGRFCGCDGCIALEEKYGATAGPLLDVILEYCPEAARLYPEHGIKMLVYRKEQTQRPPKWPGRLPDNFVVQFAPIDDDFSKDWTHPNNADTLDDLRKWCSICRRTLMWYYPNPYSGVTPPLGNVERLANDLRIMKDAGVTGLTVEHDVGVSEMTGFTELQSYVLASLWADLGRDLRTLVRGFLDFEYGAAAAGVASYLSRLETLRKETKSRFPWDASRSISYYDYLTPERLVHWESAFDRLEAILASDRTRLRNLRRLRYNLDCALLAKFREVSRALGDAAPSVESVADRIEAIAAEIAEDCYCERYADKAKAFKKSVADRVYLKRLMGGKGAAGLPAELFGNVPMEKIYVTLPTSFDGGKKPDPAAAYGVASVLEGVKKPELMRLPFVSGFQTALPSASVVPKVGRGVDAENIGPRGKYKFYDMGSVTVTPDCFLRLSNSWWFQANISEAYVPGSFNKAKVYASLKFQGPAFYPDDKAGKNQVWCDRIVVVME